MRTLVLVCKCGKKLLLNHPDRVIPHSTGWREPFEAQFGKVNIQPAKQFSGYKRMFNSEWAEYQCVKCNQAGTHGLK